MKPPYASPIRILTILLVVWMGIPQLGIGQELTPDHSVRLRLATYNVKFMFDTEDDPYTLDTNRPSKSDESIQALCTVIKSINADVIVLQEIESFGYLSWFNRVYLSELKYSHVVLLPSNSAFGLHIGLLSRIQVDSASSYRFHTFEDELGTPRSFARDFLWVKLMLPNEIPFYIGVVHLKSHVGNQTYSDAWRHAEAEEIRQIIHTFFSESIYSMDDSYWCIAGDINDAPDSTTIQLLTETSAHPYYSGLIDIFHTTYHPGYTYSTRELQYALDYILVSPALHTKYIQDSVQRYPTSETARLASDHYPIWADFQW